MRGGRLVTPQGELACAVGGCGPAVVLLAGLGSTRRVWADLPRILGRHHTVIAIDNRGVGGSRNATGFSLQRAADDVAAVLDVWDMRRQLAAIGIPTLVLAGVRDPLVAVEDTRELARCMPSAKMVEVADAGHSALAEGGREILDEVLSFLQEPSRHAPPEPCG